MSAGGGNLEGAFHFLLSLDVGKVARVLRLCGVEVGARVDDSLLQRVGAVEPVGHLPEVFCAIDPYLVDDGCLADVGGGDDEVCDAHAACLDGDGQDALDGAQRAVQTEFADEHHRVEAVVVGKAVGHEQGDGQGQVVARALLADVGGGKVDRDLIDARGIARVFQRTHHACSAFTHGVVGQTDHEEVFALAEVQFEQDGDGFQPVEGGGMDVDQHGVGEIGV